MLKTVALIGAAVLGALLLHATTRPDTFQVARTATVQAPAERLHGLIADLHQFNTWNPYEKKDPQLRGEYRGPSAGPGAAYHFQGNRDVGRGSLEILASTPQRITMQLHMIDPFEARNVLEFTLAPAPEGTQVTWSMRGASPFLARLIGVFIDMDQMIGRDFEAGLGALKQRAERG
jgi:hypothetical protein